MTWIVADSFDVYAGSNDFYNSGVWDQVNQGPNVAGNITRFGVGQSAHGNGAALNKAVSPAANTFYVVFASYFDSNLSGSSVELGYSFRDGGVNGTNQCTVNLESNGNITLRSGGPTGTILATYTAAFNTRAWHHFQIRVVIDNVNGSITIRKNGATTDTFTATGLNTRSTGNSSADGIYVNIPDYAMYLDDLLVFSGAGAAPNTWVGDVRAVCLPAVADTAQKNFTGILASNTFANSGDIGGQNIAANRIYFMCANGMKTPSKAGLVTSAQLTTKGGLTGHVKMAIYLDAGGYPGQLVWVSNEVTNPSGSPVSFTYPGAWLSSRNVYWFALLTDAAWQISQAFDTLSGGNTNSFGLNQTYAAGFPSVAPAGMANNALDSQRPFLQSFTLSGNSLNVCDPIQNADTDYIYSPNVGDQDLYDMDDLIPAPPAIIGVVTKALVRKSDAGTRGGQLVVLSGGTQVLGPNLSALSTTYSYTTRVDVTDPNTGAAWTPAGVNALKVGMQVTA
jgi:hypothetical protein